MNGRIDHPLLRRTHICPICQGNKSIGCVWCWGCHNVIQASDEETRNDAEEKLDRAEATLQAFEKEIKTVTEVAASLGIGVNRIANAT